MLTSLTFLKLSTAELDELQRLAKLISFNAGVGTAQLASMSESLTKAFVPLAVGDITEDENVWISGLIQSSLRQDSPLPFSALFLAHNALVLVALRRAHNEQLKAQSANSPFIYTLY